MPPAAAPASVAATPARAPAVATPAQPAVPAAPAQAAPTQTAAAPAATTQTASAQPAPTRLGAPKEPVDNRPFLQKVWDPVANAYDNGTWEAYLPFLTYHLRSVYTAEQIASYQERPPGFGIGKGLYDEKGNWSGVYAMGFQDSHFKPSYIAGYGWKAIWHPGGDDYRVGLGYTAGLMTRADIFNYVPFPVVLPMASVSYKNFSIEGAYVPGGAGAGNVFFAWAKWEFGKKGEAVGTPAKPPPAPIEIVTPSFGPSTPLSAAKVPYGPTIQPGPDARLAAPAETAPPRVPATGPRDEEEVPDALPALALRPATKIEPFAVDKKAEQQPPIFLRSDRMGGEIDREMVAEGDAELRKIGTVVTADRLTYWPIEDEVEAEGKVRLEQGLDVVTGPKMRLKLEDQVGYFDQPFYTIKRQPAAGSQAAADKDYARQFGNQETDWLNSGFATPRVLNFAPGQLNYKESLKSPHATEGRGDADRIEFEGENQVRLLNASYTTCGPGDDSWYATAGDLKLDYDHEVATGKDAKLVFKDVPILYSPWLSFSLNNERKSGFLSPTTGTNSESGFIYAQPYYWNIAPNRDMTITPNYMSKRGFQLKDEFRYLDRAYGDVYRGQLSTEYLPSDQVRDGERRYGISLLHTQATASGFSGQINYNRVSDDNYYTDLSSSIASTSQTQLLQQGVLAYSGGGWWNVAANMQQYQTLQPDPQNPVVEQYKMLPQITLNARRPDFHDMDMTFLGQYTSFTKDKQVINGTLINDPNGDRTVLYPQLALPYVMPGWYVTPKIGVNYRHYALSNVALGKPTAIDVTLPIMSVDSGMTFERTSNWFGRDYTQTLEPRLYYVNIPHQNQDNIPIFDTALADFNFSQIFSENQFSGWDRINNANQLTAAVTSRLVEPNTGNEIMRAMLGQRFYFEPNKVGITPILSTDINNTNWDRSDLLASFSGQVLPKIFTDAALQYNIADKDFKRYSLGAHYQPEPGKTLNAAYRYNRDPSAPVDQVDFSGQWPLSGRWTVVGRVNYSFHDDGSNLSTSSQGGRMIESIAGLEYNGGCWVVRAVLHRQALTAESESSSFFIQLQLNDFSSVGTNPLNLLQRSVQGYGLVNQSAADPVFGK
jgi:LPS-assembly protein